MPSISLIIPTYNMVEFLPDALQSVIDNNFQELEIIMVNDGSTDRTAEFLDSFLQKSDAENAFTVKTFSIPHSGKAAALNTGLKQARGEYITFLDADDKLPQDSLSIRLNLLANTEADLVLGEFEVFTETGTTGKRTIPTENVPKLLHKLLYGWKTPFHLNAMLIRRSLVETAGYFDEALSRGQEKDYAIRLLKINPEISFINKPVYLYRKYRRVGRRISLRMKTCKYTNIMLVKHLSGLHKVIAILWNTLLEIAKFLYEVFGSYKK